MALVMHYDWSHALQVLHPGKMWQVEMDKDDKQILHWDDPSPRPNEADLEAWCIEMSKKEPMRILRRERDKELDMCNWRVIKAVGMGRTPTRLEGLYAGTERSATANKLGRYQVPRRRYTELIEHLLTGQLLQQIITIQLHSKKFINHPNSSSSDITKLYYIIQNYGSCNPEGKL